MPRTKCFWHALNVLNLLTTSYALVEQHPPVSKHSFVSLQQSSRWDNVFRVPLRRVDVRHRYEYQSMKRLTRPQIMVMIVCLIRTNSYDGLNAGIYNGVDKPGGLCFGYWWWWDLKNISSIVDNFISQLGMMMVRRESRGMPRPLKVTWKSPEALIEFTW